MKSYKIFFKFLKYIKPYWYQEIILFILMILVSAGTLVSPYILKIIIDDVFPSKDFELLIQIMIIMVGINIFRILLSFFSDYLYEWVSNRIMLDIRIELFNRVLHFPMNFFDNNNTGDITHRINNEVNTVQGMLTGSLVRFIKSGLTFIGLAVALCLLNYKLFLVAMIIMPLAILNMKYFQPKIHNIFKKSREKDADILEFFIEKFNNIKLIKGYNRFDFESNKLNFKIREQINFYLKSTILSSGTQSISTFLITLSPVIIFVWGGQQVITDAMTLGGLIAFIQYLNRIFNPFSDLMNLYWDLVRSSVSMKRIFEFMDLPTEKLIGGIDICDKKMSIKFQNVEFKYDEETILKKLNFEMLPGKIYAIVGNSGCGKSTIVNLLYRYYTPEKGSIFIGDELNDNINLRDLRERIAFVSQDNQLFNDSLFENIKYGNINANFNEVIEASKLVGLNEYTKDLEDGVHTIIGDKGTKLSGGQKQRIAIARAILKNPDIIILDEATSALDSESENKIFETLTHIFKDKIIILISHRLSAIKNVDEIICLDKGLIIEKGNHSLLTKNKGFYWNLFKQQIN